MKIPTAVVVVTLALAPRVMAQIDFPRTAPFKNAEGYTIGTATYFGDRITLRWSDGTLYGTVVVAADGKRTFYDPNGKVVTNPTIALEEKK